MNNLKSLSFENIKVEQSCDKLFGERIIFKVFDDNGDCLAEAIGRNFKLKEFASTYYYPELVYKEIEHYFFGLDKESKSKVQYMSLSDMVSYLNERYGEDEVSTLNWLYDCYNKLNEYNRSNVLDGESDCLSLYSITSNVEDTGTGTLIVDYLKKKYNLIFLYSTLDAEAYWLDKVDFKEILNGYLYWSEDTKLKELL